MYLPSHFQEADPAVLGRLIADHPLASLVTQSPTGLDFSPVPLHYDPTPAPKAPHGHLRGHLALANPHWRHIQPAGEALAIFTGPNAYISPNWYPSKAEHGKAVPTWNYAVVEARGPVRVIRDSHELLALLHQLTDRHEAKQPHPWSIDDAPPDFVATQLKAIVGIEMAVQQLSGKWKVSQNRNAADRAGALAGLTESMGPGAAELVRP